MSFLLGWAPQVAGGGVAGRGGRVNGVAQGRSSEAAGLDRDWLGSVSLGSRPRLLSGSPLRGWPWWSAVRGGWVRRAHAEPVRVQGTVANAGVIVVKVSRPQYRGRG